MKRRPKNKTARYRSYARRALILAILLSVALLFTWTYLRSAVLSVLIGVSVGETGTLTDSVAGEAVFSGGSSIVSAPAPGAVRFLVASGESVRMGQAIAEVGAPQAAAAFEESLRYAKARLAEYERETEEEFTTLLARVQPAYERAVLVFFDMQEGYASGELAKARDAEQELAEIGASMAADRASLIDIEEGRARLAANVASIAAAQKASAVQVLAPASGTFVFDFSDVETKLTREALASKDASQIMALAREARQSQSLSVKDGQAVAAGDILGRVVSGQNVMFFLPVRTEERPDVEKGREVDVVFTGSGERESGVIVGIEDGKPPGYSVIVGEIPIIAAGKMVHAGSISLTIRSRTGILIPKTAIIGKGGKTGVLAVQKTYARFVPVEVLMTKGDSAVVRGISAGDEVVARALKFFEGKRVR